MAPETNTVAGWARARWRMRLDSAFRAALACALVSSAAHYGPKLLTKEIKFVSFSYLTAVSIVYDATLGGALRGCWHAVYATAQVVPAAALARWAAGDRGVPVAAAALAAAAASFAVTVVAGGSSQLTARRIALGQIVLVCSGAVSEGGGWMGPVCVASSTGLGALASVLALLLPYPGLA